MRNGNKSVSQVHAVKNVSLSRIKTDSGTDALLIVAEGEVTSTGWTNPELSRHIYAQPPLDGVQGFNFVASPPQGHSRPVVTPIRVEHTMTDIPDWLTGVRVHAEKNCEEVHLE